MKKFLSLLIVLCLSSYAFAGSKSSKAKHVSSKVSKEMPQLPVLTQAKEIKQPNGPMQPEDLEKLNLAIDSGEDVHVVSVDYDNGRLKNMKVDAFVVNNDIQLSTTYVLSFENNTLELTIEDYLTGLENTIPPTKEEKQSYKTETYAVECFKKGEEYHSTFKRTVEGSYKTPVISGMTSCHAPADDELQIIQKLQMDNEQFVSSVREGVQANIQSVLDEEKRGVSFVILDAKTAPGKLLHELFESKLRVYFYNNMLSTLLQHDTPKTQETQLKDHKAQG